MIRHPAHTLRRWLGAGFCLAAVVCRYATAAEVEIRLTPTFSGVPLSLDSLRYDVAKDEVVSVTRLSLLTSHWAFERAAGGWVELPDQVLWWDGGQRRLTGVLKDVPEESFRAVRFGIGLDPATNSADVAKWPADHPLNPNVNGLHWSWQGGYIFLAIEGLSRRANDEPQGFVWHLARDPSFTVITVPTEIAVGRSAGLAIAFDLGAAFRGPRPISPGSSGTATHSREGDPIAAALKANLSGAFQVRRVLGDATAPGLAPVAPLHLPEKFTAFPFRMSGRFPIPALPRDNPLTEERVALGRRLFSEPLLSRDRTLSCASCHLSDRGFSDPRPFSVGVEGRTGKRQAMPLFNLAWKSRFFWDGRAASLREQVLQPIQDHAEMDASLDAVVAALRQTVDYPKLFESAFGTAGITAETLSLALENYLLTLVSGDSRFDRAMKGEVALTEVEKRGFELFFTEFDPRTRQAGADCFHCHGGALFSDHQFHNTGLDEVSSDSGRAAVTKADADTGKFVTPSLRNVALTAPYMHDGRFATLEQAVAHYTDGVKASPRLDPNLAKHPGGRLPLGDADKAALVAFLRTLTDESLAEKR